MMNAIKTTRLPALFLLLGLCLAMPAPAFAGNNNNKAASTKMPPTGVGSPIPGGRKVIRITPPKTSAHVDLKPYDDAVLIVNLWYCFGKGDGLDWNRRVVEKLFRQAKQHKKSDLGTPPEEVLSDLADDFLKHVSTPAVEFFNAQRQPKVINWYANPVQGKTETHTWHNCYTKQELEAYKRETIRWARYIKNIWFPQHKKGRK